MEQRTSVLLSQMVVQYRQLAHAGYVHAADWLERSAPEHKRGAQVYCPINYNVR